MPVYVPITHPKVLERLDRVLGHVARAAEEADLAAAAEAERRSMTATTEETSGGDGPAAG